MLDKQIRELEGHVEKILEWRWVPSISDDTWRELQDACNSRREDKARDACKDISKQFPSAQRGGQVQVQGQDDPSGSEEIAMMPPRFQRNLQNWEHLGVEELFRFVEDIMTYKN